MTSASKVSRKIGILSESEVGERVDVEVPRACVREAPMIAPSIALECLQMPEEQRLRAALAEQTQWASGVLPLLTAPLVSTQPGSPRHFVCLRSRLVIPSAKINVGASVARAKAFLIQGI